MTRILPQANATMPTEHTISELITAVERGERSAPDALFSALYAELHRLAQRQLARHGGPSSLGATTLLHEAYLDIASRDPSFPDRARFMGYAAKVMRGLIIDQARSHRAQKRGRRIELTTFDTSVHESRVDDRELTRMGETLDELAQTDRELAEVVDLKFFCGFTFAEIATMRGVSERTVKRAWEKARICLYRGLRS